MSGSGRRWGRRGELLVAAQAVAIVAVAWPQEAMWSLPRWVLAAAWLLALAGAALAVAGAIPYGSRLTPFVVPPRGTRLLTGGAYRLVRHPIYSGLLAAMFAVAVSHEEPIALLSWVGLLMVLRVKVGIEEDLLRRHFGQCYRAYAARVPRRGL